MTQVLVTGAAGFIGSHLCEALIARGCTVRGLDSFTTFYDPERKRGNLDDLVHDPAFELVAGDLLTARLDEVLDGVDAVAPGNASRRTTTSGRRRCSCTAATSASSTSTARRWPSRRSTSDGSAPSCATSASAP